MRGLIIISLIVFSSQLSASIYLERDPFMPFDLSQSLYKNKPISKDAPKVKSSIVKVTGIIWEEASPMAVVSFAGRRQIIGLGDLLFSKKVTKISKKYVWLKGDEKTLILKIGKEMRL
ncbi:hypothetical protein DID80_04300 [Candidatus Marinamargulisbacteria bacterium SCGC AAA071-K20]|nr:hypothetical protein DID80_04300 [Candidatus Marinamargulisbacteria bacterium SCGC AAA071-K20]